MNEPAYVRTGDESPPLALWIGFIAMTVGNFMAILDIQIVASSISTIQAGVSASRDEISWVQTAYLIAEVIGIPLSGFLGRAMGTRLLFCTSSLLFSLTSVLCAMSWDLPSLIVFRALQGFTGAAMIPTTMATLYIIFPPRLQPVVGPMIGMASTLAPSIGPTLGGYIAESMGWRALFWINVLPGIAVTALIWRYLRIGGADFSLFKRIDFAGLVGLALFLGAAEYVLEEGPSNGWFADSEIVFWACVSAAGAILFFWRAASAHSPIVDLRPFRNPTFALGATLGFVLGISMFTSIFLTPLFLGSVRGFGSMQIGHTMFVQGVTMFLCAPIMGRVGRMVEDTRPMGFVGFLMLAYSCWLQAHFTADAGLDQLILPQILRGIGSMLTFTSVMQPALQSLEPSLLHAGAGLFNTVRNVGGAFGIAFLSTIQAKAFLLHRQELYTALDPNNPHVRGMLQGMQAYLAQHDAVDPHRQALLFYSQTLDREALVMTFNDQFLYLSVIVLISAAPLWLLKRKPSLGFQQMRQDVAAEAH